MVFKCTVVLELLS